MIHLADRDYYLSKKKELAKVRAEQIKRALELFREGKPSITAFD